MRESGQYFLRLSPQGELTRIHRIYPRKMPENFGWDYPGKRLLQKMQGEIVGTYYIKTNQIGPGSHVCNCGYMVTSKKRDKGIATAMCAQSHKIARELAYQAMQFSFVAASNQGAIRLWNKLGYETVGRLPKAFNHPEKGYIDALVMFKWLVPDS